jgi:tetratricopeptide (TPR) repeat protein
MTQTFRARTRFLFSGVLALWLAAPAASDGLSGAYLAARQAMIANDFQEAAEYYARALARDRTNAFLIENTLIANVGLGRIKESVPIARVLIADEPGSQIGQMVLVAHSLNSGADIGVLDELQGTGRIAPLIDTLLAGWGWMNVGDAAEAMAAFDGLISNPEYGGFAVYHKALANAYVGNFEETVRLLGGNAETQAIRTRRSVLALAISLGQLDRFDEATALLEESFDLSDAEIRFYYTPLSEGQAVPFDLIQSPQDGMGEAFYSLAQALRGQATDEFTLIYARFAQYLSPNNDDATILSARLLEGLEQYELATQAFDQVSRKSPAYLKAEIGRAEALNRTEKPDAAIEVLMQLAETHAEVPLVHTTLGDIYRRMNEFEKSADAYDRAIALYGAEEDSQWFVYYTRGISHERIGDWEAAEADFRKALDLNPGQPNVLNYLGYSLVETRSKLDEALNMIREASAARPESGYITDSLGWVLYRLGRFEEAVEPMERAASLMPVDPVINDHLGDVYWAVGREREAEFQWRRALSFLTEDDEDHEADPKRIRLKLEVGLDAVIEDEGGPSLAEKAALRQTQDDG